MARDGCVVQMTADPQSILRRVVRCCAYVCYMCDVLCEGGNREGGYISWAESSVVYGWIQ